MRHAPARHDAGWRRDPGTRQGRGLREGLGTRDGGPGPGEGRGPGQDPGAREGRVTRGPREGRATRDGGPGARHGAGYRGYAGVWGGPRGHRAARWRADPGRGTAGLRRFWPAAMTPAAIAACTLGAVALAGLIVIAVSMAVAAYGPGSLAAGGSLSQALESCSGELALLALTVAVVLGVAATERHFLPARTRVTAQLVHRAVALIAVGFLVVHILLETVSDQAGPLAAVFPFTDAADRLYLGLGTIASDLVIAIIGTSLARMRYARSAHPQLWRMVHRSIYVAWPLAILHGILMGGGPAWAAWTYGICAALVAVAISARVRMQDTTPRAPGADLGDLADLTPWPGDYLPAGDDPYGPQPPAGEYPPGGDDPYGPRPPAGEYLPGGGDPYGPQPGDYLAIGDHPYASCPQAGGGALAGGDAQADGDLRAGGDPYAAPRPARRRAWRPVEPRPPGAAGPPGPPGPPP
jgi:DMSO/TMAO reductase YedYZ heme-binding membrane subunit